ncbi:YheC/YheD family protein [Shimazuella sp. AN120528]|uniref:YheC/YheD family endospore coat-associated protein n=1 Tax=Shimazuella soli TaxID=1892854 RepID=UPI001F10B794|nr:YheC/YheD family protein [Shimazuella soli]MCH5584333.1 YheC/YheD family protein [Shimazuella soli]
MISNKLYRTVGIIVCTQKNVLKVPPFPESIYFFQLAKIAKQNQLEICIFNPQHINWENRTVPAWHVEGNKWKFGIKALPFVIYDRCYYTSTAHFQQYRAHILRIHQDKTVQFLGRALGGKMQTYNMLRTNQEIEPYLPETKIYSGTSSFLSMLNQYPKVCIKPNGGSHGIGVVSIEQVQDGYHIRGRNKANFPFEKRISTQQQLVAWVQTFIQKTRYLIQPFLSLQTADGSPFDLRILIQKNGKQQWETTGKAIRIGKEKSITSNLHGGGDAKKLEPFLADNFHEEQIEAIKAQIEKIAMIVPSHIEKQHGKLVELGLDVGIDRHAHVWIIEVNSKPGRSVFLRTGEKEIRKRSMELPIQYAKALLSQKVGGY